MPEIDEKDATNIIIEYYQSQGYEPNEAARMATILSRADVLGLVIYTFSRGVEDMRVTK